MMQRIFCNHCKTSQPVSLRIPYRRGPYPVVQATNARSSICRCECVYSVFATYVELFQKPADTNICRIYAIIRAKALHTATPD